MKHEKTSTEHQPVRRKHKRTQDLESILGILNIWAMAPQMEDRTKGLRDALAAYKRAVMDKQYPSMRKDFCAATEDCLEAPAGSFEYYFPSDNEGSKTPARKAQ